MVELTLGQRTKLRIGGQIVLAGNFLGFVFVVLRFGFGELYFFANATVIATLASLIIFFVEFSYFLNRNKQYKFWYLLSIKFLIYAISFIIILFNVSVISRMIKFRSTFSEILSSIDFNEYLMDGTFRIEVIYMLIFTFIINFIIMMNRKLGPGMLWAFIKGTYYRPVRQMRVVLFVKIVDAKKALLKLGPLKYQDFLNQVFYEITIPALLNEGVIHEYIDDLVVLTWQLNDGSNMEGCYLTYFDILDRIKRKEKFYKDEFGMVPSVCGALHVGTLMASEIGEIKTQIALLGDTLNTAARILQKCYQLNLGILASREILGLISLPRYFNKEEIGNIQLKGKQEALMLFEIKKTDRENELSKIT